MGMIETDTTRNVATCCRNGLWRRTRAAWSQGEGTFFHRVLRRAAQWPCCRSWLRVSVVELLHVTLAEHKRFRRIPRTFQVRRAEKGDVANLVPLFPDAARVAERLDRGDVCLLAERGGEPCAGVWLSMGPTTYDEDWQDSGCTYQIPAGAAWTYDGRGRRMGAWGCLMAHLPSHLEELGADEVFTSIDLGNHLSTDSHRSLGYRPIGLVSHVWLLGLARRRMKPLDGTWQALPGTLAGLRLADK